MNPSDPPSLIPELVPALTSRERSILRRFLRAERSLLTALDRGLASADLSWQDHEVLATLAGRPARRLLAGELAEALGWEKSRLSHHVDRMERRGLVVREQSHDNLRHWFVVLTNAGRDALAAAATVHLAAARTYFTERLTAEQLDQLDAIATALVGPPDSAS